MPNLEAIELKPIDGIPLFGLRYVGGTKFVEISGADAVSDMAYRVCTDFQLVRWPTMLVAETAREKLLHIGSTIGQFTIEAVYQDDPDTAQTIGLNDFRAIEVASLLQVGLFGEEDKPNFSWRLPYPDEEHNQAFVYLEVDDALSSPSLIELVTSTIAPEKLPTNVGRTLTAFHKVYERHVGQIMD